MANSDRHGSATSAPGIALTPSWCGIEDWQAVADGDVVGLSFHEFVTNYADGTPRATAPGAGELGGQEAFDRGVLIAPVFPTATLAPGCSTQSSSGGRLIPLVVYGTTDFDASAIDTGLLILWNPAIPTATFVVDVDSDTHDDWVGHFPADDVAAASGSSVFNAQLTTSQFVLAQPAITFGTVSDTDGDGLDDNCDQCPSVFGAGFDGC